MEIYELLNKAAVNFEVIEIFEGSRFIRVEVEEEVGEQYASTN